MKPCEHTGCKEMIDEKYHYCYAHFRGANTIKNVPESLPAGAWHSDPIVDAASKAISYTVDQWISPVRPRDSAPPDVLCPVGESVPTEVEPG